MKQIDRVLKHCKKYGFITTRDAILHCRIADLQGVIRDIKKLGYTVTDERISYRDIEDEYVWYKKYYVECE